MFRSLLKDSNWEVQFSKNNIEEKMTIFDYLFFIKHNVYNIFCLKNFSVLTKIGVKSFLLLLLVCVSCKPKEQWVVEKNWLIYLHCENPNSIKYLPFTDVIPKFDRRVSFDTFYVYPIRYTREQFNKQLNYKTTDSLESLLKDFDSYCKYFNSSLFTKSWEITSPQGYKYLVQLKKEAETRSSPTILDRRMKYQCYSIRFWDKHNQAYTIEDDELLIYCSKEYGAFLMSLGSIRAFLMSKNEYSEQQLISSKSLGLLPFNVYYEREEYDLPAWESRK